MRSCNEDQWSRSRHEIHHSGEIGQRFLAFFEFLFDAAEQYLDEYVQAPAVNADMAEYVRRYAPAEAVRKALALAEQTFGFLEPIIIGQILTCGATHWVHGEEMVEGLTLIERRVLEWALAVKIQDLSESASIPVVNSSG
jgi:hypothetical protein